MNYVSNRPNGHAVMYNDNANNSISEEGTWLGTRWVGKYQLFYPPPGNRVRMEYFYSKNGQRDSVQTYYYPNGKVAIRASMKSGAACGYTYEYDTSGRLFRQTYYDCSSGNSRKDTTKTKIFPPVPSQALHEIMEPDQWQWPRNGQVQVKSFDPDNKSSNNQDSDSIYNSLNCGCVGDEMKSLYQLRQMTAKGCFQNSILICGLQFVYDKNGILIRIKKYKDGKYIGDAPLPADTNK